MKKMAVFISSVCLTLLLTSVYLAAEAIDLSSMDYSSLVSLQKELLVEIASRPESEPLILSEGDYTVGTDIPEGEYNVVIHYTIGTDYVAVGLYETEEAYKNDQDSLFYEHLHLYDSPMVIELKTGNFLRIMFGDIQLKSSDFTEGELYSYAVPEGTMVPVGNYVVGEDIPVGKYNVYASGIYKDSAFVLVYKDEEKYKNSDQYGYPSDYNFRIVPEEPVALDLFEGYIVSVVQQEVIMKKPEKLLFE